MPVPVSVTIARRIGRAGDAPSRITTPLMVAEPAGAFRSGVSRAAPCRASAGTGAHTTSALTTAAVRICIVI